MRSAAGSRRRPPRPEAGGGTAPGASPRELLAGATRRLAAAGVETPRLDAELLLAHALGTDRAGLFRLDPRQPLPRARWCALGPDSDPKAHHLAAEAPTESDDPARRFAALVERRATHEPVAYLIGLRAFRGIELAVDARVLVPRPESEGLVEAALELPARARVIDVGCGSGAVALALKSERPDLDVVASDVDPGALACARENARRLGLDVAVVRADLLDGAPGPFDAVLSNPPYIAEGDVLAPGIAEHEPARALYGGGADGLDVIRALIAAAAGTPLVALEVGEGRAEAVERLAREAGARAVERRRDLAGIERIVVCRWS